MRKTVILDKNILIDYVHGFAPQFERLTNNQSQYQLIIPTIVKAEYLTADEMETEIGKKRADAYLGNYESQDLTSEIAEILGTILRRKTYIKSASMADLIIAATALYFDAPLLTRNKADFAKIPNLRFFEWEEI